MDELEFKSLVKQILSETRQKTLNDVRSLLEFGDEFGDVDIGGWNDLAKLAGGPGDVVKATMGSVANISNKTRTLLSMVLRGIPALVLPGISTKFEKIMQDESRRQSEIERMYPEIFSIARKGFPKDAELFAFMVSPATLMTWALAKMGADLTLDLIDAFSGQSPDVMSKTKVLRRRTATREALEILETSDSTNVAQFIKDAEFVNEFSKLKPVIEISTAFRGLKNDSLHNVIQIADDIANANSIEELESLDINFQLDDAKQKEVASANALGQVLGKVKSTALEALVEKIKKQSIELENVKVPKNANIFRAYKRTLEKLNGHLQISKKDNIETNKKTHVSNEA